MTNTKNKKTDIKEEPETMDLSEDMDTDDLLDQTDGILSNNDRSDMETDQDTDDLLDHIDARTTTKKGHKQTAKKETTTTTTTTTSTKGRKKPTTQPANGTTTTAKKGYNLERSKQLAEQYPDTYWKYHGDSGHSMIDRINSEYTLQPLQTDVNDQGAITSMALSSTGQILATFSTIGSIKLWDVEGGMKLVQKLRDENEKNIEEFYCGHFVEGAPDLLIAGGKLKDRSRWSKEDEDNHILPCPIKIFHIATGKMMAKLEGHEEEILSIKTLRFNGDNYYISTSQDGRIIKWKMADDWTTLIESQKMDDELTCMAFTISFLPNCGNKYFLACCDEHVRLYDFEHGKLLQSFEHLYSSYCDCGKVIEFLDESLYWENLKDKKKVKAAQDEQYAWFITRGVELCDDNGLSTTPNLCRLHRLVYPKKDGGKFVMEEMKQYKNEAYCSNSWLVKITTNGRYLLAPTIYGQVFVFNLLSGQITAVLKNHQDVEVRDVLFHPYAPLLFTSGDDGRVYVYTTVPSNPKQDGESNMDIDGNDKLDENDAMNQDLKVGLSSEAKSTTS